MSKKAVRFLVFTLFVAGLSFSIPLTGQNVNDAGLWTTFKLEAKVVKKLNASILQEFRFNENITELGAFFTEAGLEYKINKHFQVEVNYRFTQRRKVEDYYSYRHRFGVDVKYSKKIKPLELKLRSRLQDQYADIGRSDDGGVAEYYLRNKIGVNWDTKKAYTPYFSVEFYSPLNYPRYAVFDNIRTMAGVEYAFSKHHKLDLYYLVHKELNVSLPTTYFVVGLGYTYKI
jgi:hypothetical protein